MSAVLGSYTYEMDASYAADFSRDREPMKTRSRHPEYRRKGSAPSRVNGMHCRRNKRWSWGSGRGARMSNVRAFASCVAVAIAALASQGAFAQSVSFNLVNITNPGNAGNPAVSGSLGSVGYLYKMADSEVTNAQYANFLNKVDPTGANSLGLWNSQMGSNFSGGITNTGTVNGSRYVVKSGGPTATGTPVGTTYATMPVNFVNWFSAARFVNWLNAGQPTNSTSMNSGVYAVNSSTSGNIVARSISNPNVNTFVLPSQNEWYKAAFYTGTGSTYTTFATNNNTTPITTNTTTIANSANGQNKSPTPANVNAYANQSQSAYGMYSMFGNVGEMTDTAAAGGANYVWTSGGFGANPSGWSAIAAVQTRLATTVDVSNGFRVAQVAAVPEPETITLAAFGIVGLCGANWLKRRRKSTTQPVAECDELTA